MAALREAVVESVQRLFPDRDYLASPAWALAGERLRGIDASPRGRAAAMQNVLDGLPLSHVQLLSPSLVAASSATDPGLRACAQMT